MAKIKVLDWVALVLLIVGGLNWGLVAINPAWNVVELLLGSIPVLARIIYAIVGLSALYTIYFAVKMKK